MPLTRRSEMTWPGMMVIPSNPARTPRAQPSTGPVNSKRSLEDSCVHLTPTRPGRKHCRTEDTGARRRPQGTLHTGSGSLAAKRPAGCSAQRCLTPFLRETGGRKNRHTLNSVRHSDCECGCTGRGSRRHDRKRVGCVQACIARRRRTTLTHERKEGASRRTLRFLHSADRALLGGRAYARAANGGTILPALSRSHHACRHSGRSPATEPAGRRAKRRPRELPQRKPKTEGLAPSRPSAPTPYSPVSNP